jgi:hypothetical protein
LVSLFSFRVEEFRNWAVRRSGMTGFGRGGSAALRPPKGGMKQSLMRFWITF